MSSNNKKYSTIIVFLFILSLCFSAAGCSGTTTTQGGNITISGAFALYPMVVKWSEEYHKVQPSVTFDVSAGGAGKGMADALSNIVDIGMVSREVKPEEVEQGAFAIAVTRDAVFPTINANNPYIERLMAQGLTQETLAKIFISTEITTWGEVLNDPAITDEIHLYTRSDSCGAAEVWSKYLGGTTQEDLKGIAVSGDPGLLDAVVQDALGIGYNNLGYAFDIKTGSPVAGALVIPIDTNKDGKADDAERLETMQEAIAAITSGKYPSPPARVLYLVTKDKPTGIVKDFLTWILKDGQQFVSEAGYVALPQDQIDTELNKIP